MFYSSLDYEMWVKNVSYFYFCSSRLLFRRVVVVWTRICTAEMAVRYAALSACRKVRMPSVRAEKYIRDASGWRKDVTDGNDNGTDGQTDRRADRVRRNMRPPPREEGRIISLEVMSLWCLCHCLYVCLQDNSKSCQRILMNVFGGGRLDFCDAWIMMQIQYCL